MDKFTLNATEALAELDLLGAPLFLLQPGTTIKGKYGPPGRWQKTDPEHNEQVIRGWKPGYGVGMVCGTAYDVIDVDPRNGGDASLVKMQDDGLLPPVRKVVSTPSGGLHLYISPLDVGKAAPLPGIDYQARGSFVFAPPTEGYSELPRADWPGLRQQADGTALRALVERQTPVHVDADTTPYDALPANMRELADARVQRAVDGFRRRLDRAQHWDEGEQDEHGRGWEKLTADAAFHLAQLGHAPWTALELDAAEDLYHDMVPHVMRLDFKCSDKWNSQEFRAAAKPLPAPWQEDFTDMPETEVQPSTPDSPQAPEQPLMGREEAMYQERLLWHRADTRARQTVRAEEQREEARGEAKDGGSFLFDLPDKVPAIWGNDSEVLWAKGEACMIVGPPGVGKTTLTAQVVRGLMGLQSTVLGYRVEPTERVLYMAMDRPKQIARALARTFRGDAAKRQIISDKLVPWEGPPPEDLAANPKAMLEMAQAVGATVIVVDSLKDAAVGLSEDAVGAGYNRARQMCLAAGIEVLELHHQKKAGTGGGKPNTLADVYGSTWLTAGAGSVLLLWGEAGDPIVELRHVKQPMDPIGPFNVVHDHEHGRSAVQDDADPVELAEAIGRLTVYDAAAAVYGAKFTNAQKEKMRRRLSKLAEKGKLASWQEKDSNNRDVTVYGPADDDGIF